LLIQSPSREVRLASSIIRDIGATVMQPIAIEVATVTAERGPKTDASNGRPTAAELGNPTVNAITELSAAVRCCRDRDQKKLIAYKGYTQSPIQGLVRPARASLASVC
jgi:hypothetical protein